MIHHKATRQQVERNPTCSVCNLISLALQVVCFHGSVAERERVRREVSAIDCIVKLDCSIMFGVE
jgi:hypothetical protein